MTLYYNLPVYKDTYDLVLLIFNFTRDFPKDYKYTIGQDLKKDTMDLVREIYKINRARDKQTSFDEFQEKFELIKLQIRICNSLQLLNHKQLARVNLLMSDIGKQISGWSKSNKIKEE